MSRINTFQKPENALKRAAELKAIGQPDEALQVLHSAIGHRFFRTQGWDNIQEQIMLEYVTLCIEQDKLRMAKDGLHQYRLIAQHANVASLGKVVMELLEHAEARLHKIKKELAESGAKVALESRKPILTHQSIDIDGFETDYEESPESLMASTLQLEVRDSTTKMLHNVYKFLWETYRMILDIMRATPKLERVYHETARKAITFCKENDRVMEFKRLCDVVRGHYSFLQKVKNKPEMECMLKPELHIETRINQLIASCDMGLYKEAFNTVEDLYTLGMRNYIVCTFHITSSKNFPSTILGQQREKLLKWLAIFYEKLAIIFKVSDLFIFHALALLRYANHIKLYNKKVTEQELQLLYTQVVLAVISIPATTGDLTLTSSNSNFEMQRRMSNLLGCNSIPTRASMITSIQTLLPLIHSDVRDLYNLVEETKIMQSICGETLQMLNRISSSLSCVESNCETTTVHISPDATPTSDVSVCHEDTQVQKAGITFDLHYYIKSIKYNIFQRMLLYISTIYSTMKISFFVTRQCPPEYYKWPIAEQFIVDMVHRGVFNVRIDYEAGILIFNNLSKESYRNLSTILNNLGCNLTSALKKLNTNSVINREQHINILRNQVDKERVRMIKRISEISQRRIEHQEQQQRVEDERRKKLEEEKVEQEIAEKIRREEAQKQMELQRRKEEKTKIKNDTAQQMLEIIRKLCDSKMVVKSKTVEDLTIQDIMDGYIDYTDIEKAQEEQREREGSEKIKFFKAETKRIDHYIRALREVNQGKYEKWKEEVKARDHEILEQFKKSNEERYKRDEEEMKVEKEIYTRYIEDKQEWCNRNIYLKSLKISRARARLEEKIRQDHLQKQRMEQIERERIEQVHRERQERERQERERIEEMEREREQLERDRLLQQQRSEREAIQRDPIMSRASLQRDISRESVQVDPVFSRDAMQRDFTRDTPTRDITRDTHTRDFTRDAHTRDTSNTSDDWRADARKSKPTRVFKSNIKREDSNMEEDNWRVR